MSEYTLYHGDCLDVLPTLESGSIDCVCADPPYGTTACKWDSVIPFDPMWKELKRIIKPRGAIVLFGSQPFTSALVMSNPRWFKYTWVWRKNKFTNYNNVPFQPGKAHEDIVVFSQAAASYSTNETMIYNPQKSAAAPWTRRDTGITTNYQLHTAKRAMARTSAGGRFPHSVIHFDVVQRTKHGTQKPLALLEYLIRTYTNEGDTVLDFTMGSGTTGHACGNLGRRFVGIERDKDYFDIAADRIATAYAPLRMMEAAV